MPRHFTEEDITLLEIVAARLAPAIENAQLHEFERAARAAAEEDARRLRLLQEHGGGARHDPTGRGHGRGGRSRRSLATLDTAGAAIAIVGDRRA